MVNRLYGITIAALLAIAGIACSKEEVNTFIVPSESILVAAPGEVGSTHFDSHNIASISATTVPEGWVVNNIDMYSGTITVTAPSSFDNNEVMYGTIILKGYTPIGTTATVSIYVAILQNPTIDYCKTPANCYIANKAATRYLFNPYIGGSATPLETATIALIWESPKDVIKYIDLKDGVASFYILDTKDSDDNYTGLVKPGNALIGAYNAAGELIWSWHIWITNSDPTTDTITLGNSTLMNINLGANTNSEGSTDTSKIFESYGLYYQWGRKEPIIGATDWKFSLNEDGKMYNTKGYNVKLSYESSSAECGNSEWGALHPTTIITGNKENGYDWLYEGHDDTLWSGSSKSENDPCPAGWRIPDSSIYANLTISAENDNLPWQEAQKLYGWWLEDENADKFFFTAAGRRNYLDGRLDIVNDDDIRPVPWSGYYWTATPDGENATALYFDLNSSTRTWNAINTSRAMHRANALQIRCVKE